MRNFKTLQFVRLNLFLFLFILSCAKDRSVDIPVVTFVEPKENQAYAVGDTIEVDVNIQSQSNIQSVEFTLVNEDLRPVLANYVYPVDRVTNEMSIHYAFPISDYYLAGGRYQVLCKVKNEKETKHKYQTIMVSATTKVLEDVALVTRSSGIITVWSMGPYLNKAPEVKFQLRSDYSSSAYLPFHHCLALAGSILGDLIVWDYFSEDTLFKIPALPNPPFSYFTGLSVVNNHFALSYYQGEIALLDYIGNQKKKTIALSKYYPDQVFDVGSNFIVEQKSISSSNRMITLHLGSTASQHKTFGIGGVLVGAFPFDANNFMLFFNSDGHANIRRYIFEDNATDQPSRYSGPEIKGVAQIDARNYLLTDGNQLLWYQYSRSSVSMIAEGTQMSLVEYDPLSKRAYVLNGQLVEVYSVPQGRLITSQHIEEEVLAIHLIYNR